MGISPRSVLMAGVSIFTVGAVAAAPVNAASIPSVRTATVESTSAHRQIVSTPVMLTGLVDALAALPAPTDRSEPQSPSVGAAAGVMSAGTNLMDLYFAALPWVQWGFETATWAVGWVPVVGYFSGQVMVAYYTGEPVVQSWFQSVAYLLDGNLTAIPSTLVNGVVDGFNAFIQSEINWLLGYFPPLPPFPPFPGSVALAAATLATPEPSDAAESQAPATDADASKATPVVDTIATEPVDVPAVPVSEGTETDVDTESETVVETDTVETDTAETDVAPGDESEQGQETVQDETAAEDEVDAEDETGADQPTDDTDADAESDVKDEAVSDTDTEATTDKTETSKDTAAASGSDDSPSADSSGDD